MSGIDKPREKYLPIFKAVKVDEINICDVCYIAGIDSRSISAGRTESHLELCEAHCKKTFDERWSVWVLQYYCWSKKHN